MVQPIVFGLAADSDQPRGRVDGAFRDGTNERLQQRPNLRPYGRIHRLRRATTHRG